MMKWFEPRGKHFRRTEGPLRRFGRAVTRFFSRVFPKEADLSRWNR